MRKQSRKQRENAIATIIQNAVNGWQIPMMELSAVDKAGRDVAANFVTVDLDDAGTVQAITQAVSEKLAEVAVYNGVPRSF